MDAESSTLRMVAAITYRPVIATAVWPAANLAFSAIFYTQGESATLRRFLTDTFAPYGKRLGRLNAKFCEPRGSPQQRDLNRPMGHKSATVMVLSAASASSITID